MYDVYWAYKSFYIIACLLLISEAVERAWINRNITLELSEKKVLIFAVLKVSISVLKGFNPAKNLPLTEGEILPF